MPVGSPEGWFEYGGYSSGTVDQACLQLVDLSESSNAVSSPRRLFFGFDKPSLVYQWKALRRLRIAILNWKLAGYLQQKPSPCL